MQKQKIGIVGLGMVGSQLKRYFQEKGFKRGSNLFCFDNDSKKSFKDNINKADIIFVCVPTPKKSDGSCDIKIIESVIKKWSQQRKIIVVKSTVEPGTVARLQKKYKCPILFNPEFLTESRAWEDCVKPDRQIVGYTDKSRSYSSIVLSILPQAFFSSPGVLDTYDFFRLTSTEAEMGKYAGNVFGAIKVSYANVLANLCQGLEKILEKEGIHEKVDYNNVKEVLSHDGRIGGAWLDIDHGKYYGFGGFCFPKDTSAFISFAKKIEKKLDKSDPNKKLVKSGLAVLEAVWDYNKELLKSQGLTIKMVSSHDGELTKKLKKLKISSK